MLRSFISISCLIGLSYSPTPTLRYTGVGHLVPARPARHQGQHIQPIKQTHMFTSLRACVAQERTQRAYFEKTGTPMLMDYVKLELADRVCVHACMLWFV